MISAIPAKEFCESIFDGTHDTPKPVDSGYPLVTSKHITGGKLDMSTAYNISHNDYDAIQRRSAVSQWDVLFSMIGSVGEVYIEKNTEIPYAIKNIGVFSCKDESRAKWLYYYLQSPSAQIHLKRYSNGAVQKFLPLGALRDFPIQPYNANSNRIIEVLTSLDDKIELNNCINTELESMAKTLYNYWFLQFDFPDKNSKPYKSSGGKMLWNAQLKQDIPEGWNIENLKNNSLTKLIKPGVSEFDDEKIYLATADVENNTINCNADKVNFYNRESRANMQPIASSVWFAKMKNSKKVLYFNDYSTEYINNYILSTGFAGLKCEKYAVEYLWNFIDSRNFEFIKDRLASGATQEAINNNSMAFIPFIAPSKEVLESYHKKTYNVYRLIHNRQVENQKLSKLRDWLLPMLINGQVKYREYKQL